MRSGKCSQFKTLIEEFDQSRSMVALLYHTMFIFTKYNISKISKIMLPPLPSYLRDAMRRGRGERGEGGRSVYTTTQSRTADYSIKNQKSRHTHKI